MISTANNVVNIAMSFLGTKQYSEKHREIIDTFNKVKPHGYTANVSDPWCAEFWTAVQIMAGNTANEVPMSASCSMIIADSKDLGIWKESDSFKPSKGDAILYDWDDTTGSSGDCTGTPKHIGIVYAVDDKWIYVIEGNKGEDHVCGKRAVPINGKFIRGFVHPKYSKAEGKKIKYRPVTMYKGKIPKKNDVFYATTNSEATKRCQKFLNWCMNAKLEKDGKCGKKTEKWILNFQTTYGLEQDGCFGPACRKKAQKIINKHKSKKQRIIDNSLRLAWPKGTAKKKYDGKKGGPTSAFRKAYKKAFDKSPSTGCDMSVKLILKLSGFGTMSTSSWSNTNKWLRKKFKRIKPKKKNGKILRDQFKAGDIVYWKKFGDNHHIYIIVKVDGKRNRAESVQHGYSDRHGDKWFHIANGLNLDEHKVDYIYRVKS